MKFNAQVLEFTPTVERTKRDNSGTYKCAVLKVLVDSTGETKTFNTNHTGFKFNPALKEQFKKVKVGKSLCFTTQVKNGFTNLVAIGDPVGVDEQDLGETPAAARPGGRSFTNENAIGMQVGNALNNAATLVASNAAFDDLEKTCEYILSLGEDLKQRLIAGEFNKKVAKEPTSDKDVMLDDFDEPEDEDSPF